MKRLPISAKYDSPIFEAVALQIVLGLLAALIMDGGGIAQIFGIALVAFWGGVTVLVLRHPLSPSRVHIELIRFGYLPLVVILLFVTGWIFSLGDLL